MNRKRMLLLSAVGLIALGWIVLTILAQRRGTEKLLEMGDPTSPKMALVVYNPDLFHNLDEQVCTAFAKGLSEHGWQTKIATIAMAEQFESYPFDLYVFCANTYNWAPDIPTTQFIKKHGEIQGKWAVAITLGSGSTTRAKSVLEKHIKEQGGNLIGSEEYWLLRPNDETIEDRSNVSVAVKKAFEFGHVMALKIEQNELLL